MQTFANYLSFKQTLMLFFTVYSLIDSFIWILVSFFASFFIIWNKKITVYLSVWFFDFFLKRKQLKKSEKNLIF